MANQEKPHTPTQKPARDEDAARRQSEGNLGNERNRGSESARNRDEEERKRNRKGDASRLPEK